MEYDIRVFGALKAGGGTHCLMSSEKVQK